MLEKLPDDHAMRRSGSATTGRRVRRTPARARSPPDASGLTARPGPIPACGGTPASLACPLSDEPLRPDRPAFAVATAFSPVLGFLYKHKGAVASPPVEWSRPVRSSLTLFRNRWYVLGIAIAIGSWGFHVAALALAPISLVQSVIAGGLVLLTVVADRLFAHQVTRREWIGVALAALGLAFLAATLEGAAERRPLRLRGGAAWPRSSPPSPVLAADDRSRSAGEPHHAGVALGASAGLFWAASDTAIKASDRDLRREPRHGLRQPARPAHHRCLVRRPDRLREEPADRQGGPRHRDDHRRRQRPDDPLRPGRLRRPGARGYRSASPPGSSPSCSSSAPPR